MIESRVRVSAIPFIFLVSLISLFLLHESSASYAGTPAAIVYPSKVKQISWKPRAFVYQGFLTDEECDHLISLAKSELKRSAVADNLSGKSKLSEVRTSSGMFIHKGKDPIVARIEDKIAAWTFLPKENGEDIQVLRYEHGQKYDPHYDYFADKVNIARGGHRIATVLMYLTDVSKGGETVFPQAEEAPRRKPATADDDLSDCAKKGIAGCPVLEGEKWSATKWIHVDSFDKILGDVGGCADENERCEQWAALGECTKNPEYMVGTSNLPGACRRSCKVC
ncbi:hypothetical protein AQUCO_01700346v1 [Aquilegia coerulea]|uniref:procollagen-proline 4-dioxygenase n=1 Tax=Aquilegia coerulea TaxID=218851 RepID=A0A2G5DMD7_AQUCA|nr:hypothetical protein AQUCO_01700346v1 [Aquilegia coerulea]